jgi:hypothetical protein
MGLGRPIQTNPHKMGLGLRTQPHCVDGFGSFDPNLPQFTPNNAEIFYVAYIESS